jgi:hypothetical protein
LAKHWKGDKVRRLPPEVNQARVNGTPYYPMGILNGMVIAKADRQAPTCDYDETPILFRRYINASGKQDVQIWNGMRNRILTGWRMVYPGAGYLNVIQPEIPGQTRGNYGGFIPRGPSPYNFEDVFMAGPGSQPAHPGGPARIAAPQFHNPMTG